MCCQCYQIYPGLLSGFMCANFPVVCYASLFCNVSTCQEFYQFIAQRSDTPRYSLHFSADAPIMVRSLLYVPDGVNAMFGVSPGCADVCP